VRVGLRPRRDRHHVHTDAACADALGRNALEIAQALFAFKCACWPDNLAGWFIGHWSASGLIGYFDYKANALAVMRHFDLKSFRSACPRQPSWRSPCAPLGPSPAIRRISWPDRV